MLGEISGDLARAIQENIESVNKKNINARSPPRSSTSLPAVFVYSPRFTFEDSGIGGEGTEIKDDKKESFNGDGVRTSFELEGKPQRPLLRVEAPSGQVQMENVDYRMDYAKGSINFRSAPPKGKNNVSVKYNSAAGAGKTKQVHLTVVCNVDVWAGNEKQRDDITVDVISAVSLSQEKLANEGKQVKPVEGVDLYGDAGLPDKVCAKRLVYQVEANLEVKIPAPRIERVDVRQLPPK